MSKNNIAPKDMYGYDAAGVRRRIPAGSVIPSWLNFEDGDVVPATDAPAEAKRLEAAKTKREDAEAKAAREAEAEAVANAPFADLTDEQLAGYVPTATIDTLTEKVGEDVGLAKRALAAEQAAESPRVTLVGELEKLIVEDGD